MERASLVLAKLKSNSQNVSTEQLATAAWPVAVGRNIANRTTVTGLIGHRLVIEVEDYIWQRQLWALRSQILGSLEKTLGKPPVVTELEFRIAGPSRRPVQTSVQRTASDADEADAIRDPVMRSIYRAARKKATA
ncbi:MAG: DciA family protein [Bryobacteraceae bacterium]|nr:DciA family protein [Bryobacteraceae bacterium]